MAKISRQVGTTNQILDLFIQDAASSSGAGLPNVSAFTFTWWRAPGQAAVSSAAGTTTGSMGVYSTGALIQLSSTAALGRYQFGAPDGMFVSGDTAHLQVFGFPGMVPLPLEIELTKTNNQQYASSTNYSSAANVVANVGVSSVPAVGVSSFAIGVGVSSFAIAVGVSSFAIPVGVSSVANPVGVSTIPAVGVSSFAIAVGVSSFAIPVGVSSMAVAVNASSVTGGVNVTNIAAAQLASIAATTLSTTQAFTLADSSAPRSLMQLGYEVLQNLTNFTNSGDTRTLNNLDGAATSVIYQYDSSTAPAAITRVA